MLIDIIFNMENTTRACKIFTYYCLTIGIRNIIFYSVNKLTLYDYATQNSPCYLA